MRIWEAMTDAGPGEWRKKLYDGLSRHLVCLGVRIEDFDASGNPKPNQRVFSFSTFAYSDGERWFLVTAGHIVAELLEGLNGRHFRIVHFYLADYLSRAGANKMLLPFPLDLHAVPFIHDDSLPVDFACIELSDIFKMNLQANSVVPIRAEDCSENSFGSFSSHWILGLPREVSRELNNSIEDCTELRRKLAIVMVPIEAIEDNSQLPPDIARQEAQKPLPSLTGKITVEPDFDIDGMSGGPTFGVIYQDAIHMQYSLVAIQSSWHKRSRTTFGCPWPVFKELIGMNRLEILAWAERKRRHARP